VEVSGLLIPGALLEVDVLAIGTTTP